MNIEQFSTEEKANEGAVMEVVNPQTDEVWMDGDNPITITVMGVDSKEFERIQKESDERDLKVLTKKQKQKSLREENISRAIKLTNGWSGIGDSTGDLEFNYSNALKVYTSCPWLREQVLAFAGDRDNYFRGAD